MEVKHDPYLHRAFYSALEQALVGLVLQIQERRFEPRMTGTIKSLYAMIPALRVDAVDDGLSEVENLMATLAVMEPTMLREQPHLQRVVVERCARIATFIRGRSRSPNAQVQSDAGRNRALQHGSRG